MKGNNLFKNVSNMASKIQDRIVKTDIPFDLDAIKGKINLEAFRRQIIELIQKAINNIGSEKDRNEVVNWFVSAKDTLDKDTPKIERAKELYASMDSIKVVKIFFTSLGGTLKNYMNSNLPLPIKVALPITAIATLFLGTQGAGIVALGGGIGLPVIILFFIGSAGITAIVEPFVNKDMSEGAKVFFASTISALGVLVLHNKLSKSLEEQIKKEATSPKKQKLSEDEEKLKLELQTMDPFDFERHIMSFFESAGMKAAATKATNDFGLDGWAIHEKGLIIVQCKRNSDDNKVGRPTIQQFKGVIEEQRSKGSEIYKGYVVTTSSFSKEAIESAQLNSDVVLVDIQELINVWHKEGICF